MKRKKAREPSNADGSSTTGKGGWAEIIKAVATPLNFFALLVMVIEAILTLGVTHANLSGDQQFSLFQWMLGVLCFLVVVVGFLTWTRPRHLSPEMAKALEASEEAIKIAKEVQKFLNRKSFEDAIVDVLERQVQPDALVKPALETRKPDE